jgi:hypothetical protein
MVLHGAAARVSTGSGQHGGITSIDFDHPDETRTFPHGRVDIVHVGASTIGRGTLEPGWHWDTDIKPIAGTDSCQFRHVGFMVSGRMKITTEDGSEKEIGPGQAYVIEPAHDAVVIGDESAVGTEFSATAAEGFAKPSS